MSRSFSAVFSDEDNPSDMNAGKQPTEPVNAPRPYRTEALHILALATREQEAIRSIRTYLKSTFPNAHVTYVLPASFIAEMGDIGDHEEVVSYTAGGTETWKQKLRVVLKLLRVPFHYCAFLQDFQYKVPHDFVLLLPLLIRTRHLLLLDPDTGAKGFRKSGFLVHYLKCCRDLFLVKAEMKSREFYYRTIEKRLGTKPDMLIWFFLVFLARGIRPLALRLSLRAAKKKREKEPSSWKAHVVHFITTLEMGGAQRQLLTLMTRAHAFPYPMSLVVYEPNTTPFEAWFCERDIPFTKIRRAPFAWDGGINRVQRFFWRHLPITLSTLRLFRLLKKQEGPILLHNWLFMANVIGPVAGALSGTPVILSSVRNLSYWKEAWYRQWWYRWADRLTAGLNDCILANAEAVRRDYQKWAGVPEEKLLTLVNGLDPEELPQKEPGLKEELKRELGLDSKDRVIGWIGRLAHEKDPAMFLEIAGHLLEKDPSLRFVMIGDGELLPEIRKARDQADFAEQVRLLGPRLDVYRWMQVMDVLVMTSIIEGMPNVLIEAQFMGIPVVTTDAGGAREVVENDRTGFVVPVGDLEALAEKTRLVLDDDSCRDRFAKGGRQRAYERFHADRMVQETRLLYDHLLSLKGLSFPDG